MSRVIGLQADVVEGEGPFINPLLVPERVERGGPKRFYRRHRSEQLRRRRPNRRAERHAIRLDTVLLSVRALAEPLAQIFCNRLTSERGVR